MGGASSGATGASGGPATGFGLNQVTFPTAPTLQTDPTQIAIPGIQQEMQQVRTNAGAQEGSSNNAALAALQRSGVAGGSEAGNALGNIAGQTAAGAAQGLAGLQQQQFGEQASLMDALNNAKTQLYGAQSQSALGQNNQANQSIGGDVGALASLAALFM